MSLDNLQDAFKSYQETVETYFSANDERQEKADALTTEKVKKIEDHLSGLEANMTKMKTAMNRPQKDDQAEQKSAHHAAFMNYLKKGVDGELAAFDTKALSAGSEPDGGYLIPRETYGQILKNLTDTCSFRSLANQITISSDAVDLVGDSGDFGAGWVAETGDRAETATGKLNRLRLVTHEMYAEPRVTQKLLDDASLDVEKWITERIVDRFARVEENSFINGDGNAKPKGILSYEDGQEWGKIQRIKSGADGAFLSEDAADTLIETVYSVKPALLQGSTWVMNRATLAEVRKFKDASGRYVWQPALSENEPATLMGYPLVVSEEMPNLGAGSLSVAFGNFNQGYMIADRDNMRMLRDPFTAKPYVKFYTTKRVGGGVVNFDAIKLIEFAA